MTCCEYYQPCTHYVTTSISLAHIMLRVLSALHTLCCEFYQPCTHYVASSISLAHIMLRVLSALHTFLVENDICCELYQPCTHPFLRGRFIKEWNQQNTKWGRQNSQKHTHTHTHSSVKKVIWGLYRLSVDAAVFWVSVLCSWVTVSQRMAFIFNSRTHNHEEEQGTLLRNVGTSYQSTRRSNPEDLLPEYEERFATNETLRRCDISGV
jgi:hypothetical protein